VRSINCLKRAGNNTVGRPPSEEDMRRCASGPQVFREVIKSCRLKAVF
jgi:hypothetical protein